MTAGFSSPTSPSASYSTLSPTVIGFVASLSSSLTLPLSTAGKISHSGSALRRKWLPAFLITVAMPFLAVPVSVLLSFPISFLKSGILLCPAYKLFCKIVQPVKLLCAETDILDGFKRPSGEPYYLILGIFIHAVFHIYTFDILNLIFSLLPGARWQPECLEESFLVAGLLHGADSEPALLAVKYVSSDGLAEYLLVPESVKIIVCDLECHPEFVAIVVESLAFCVCGSSYYGSHFRGAGKQDSCLQPDHLVIIFQRHLVHTFESHVILLPVAYFGRSL